MDAISPADFRRIEEKVDKLTDAVGRLILFVERQATQGERIGTAEQRISAAESSIGRVDRKVDQWINRGIGVWALAAVLFAATEIVGKLALR